MLLSDALCEQVYSGQSMFTGENVMLQGREHVGAIYLVFVCPGCGLYRVRWGGYYGIVRRGLCSISFCVFPFYTVFLGLLALYCSGSARSTFVSMGLLALYRLLFWMEHC